MEAYKSLNAMTVRKNRIAERSQQHSEMAIPAMKEEEALPSMPTTTKNPALVKLIREVNQETKEENLYQGVPNPNASLSALSNLRVGSGTMRNVRKSALGKDMNFNLLNVPNQFQT